MFTPLKSVPLLLPAGGWVLGLTFARLDSLSLQSCLVLLTLALLCLFKWRKPLLIACVLGLIYGLLSFAFDVQRVHVDESWLNHKINISAIIDDVKITQQYTRLRLKHITLENNEKLHGLADVYVYRSLQTFEPGMAIKARVKLRAPRNKLNPVGFDYVQYAFENHIALIGSVSGNLVIESQKHSWLNQWRSQIRDAIGAVDSESRGLLLALLLADRSQIPLDIDDAFAASGATHLLAISGLHMGLVAAWGFFMSWWLLTRREVWIVNLPVRALAMSSGLMLAMAYATLAGWPIPAQRASLMLLAGVLAWWFRAKQSPLNSMLAALILITLFDPAAVLSVSLWLSFIATSALLIWVSVQPTADSIMLKFWMWFKAMFWVSLIASIATLPLIGFIFERLPAWNLLANILMVPLYSFWVLPLALLGEFAALSGLEAVAHFLMNLSAWGLDWGNQLLLWMVDLPAGNLWLRGDLFWVYVVYPCMIIWSYLLYIKQKFKLSLFMLLMSLFLYVFMLVSQAKVESPVFHVWDVGQGASSWLQLPNFNLHIDAPGKPSSKFNGGSIAAENVRASGVLNMDAVVVTHAQSDHAGGVSRLITSLNSVGELWVADVPKNRNYFPLKRAQEKVKVRWLKQGDVIDVHDGKIKVLWPPQGYEPANGNNASLVLLVLLATGQSILLPGDMEKQVESRVLADLDENFEPVDVLLMPHHGSKTSSTEAFVQKVRPKVVIAQTGYNNHYGFPKAEVVQRYHNVGSEIWNTSQGALRISFEHGKLDVAQVSHNSGSKRADVQALINVKSLYSFGL